MSILQEIYPHNTINSWKLQDELLRGLEIAIEKGTVQEIQPSSDIPHQFGERWFLDNATGVVFRFREPNPPANGSWSEVEFPKGRGTA